LAKFPGKKILHLRRESRIKLLLNKNYYYLRMINVHDFRELCHRYGLAATHQRQVIYEALMSLPGHPSPESVYGKVRQKVPSISLGTVYKNIRTFLESGIVTEVSVHHGSLRVEANHRPHHHFVCVECKSILDLPEDEFAPVRLRHKLPPGFQVQKFVVDAVGLCSKCSTVAKTSFKKL